MIFYIVDVALEKRENSFRNMILYHDGEGDKVITDELEIYLLSDFYEFLLL